MVHLEERVSALVPEPPASMQVVFKRLVECSQAELLELLRDFKGQYWERCASHHSQKLLNRFDDILAAFADPKKAPEGTEVPSSALVCAVLRTINDLLVQHVELKGVFSSTDRLRDLLESTDLDVVLATVRCLSIVPVGRTIRGGMSGMSTERRLEVLATGTALPASLHRSCAQERPVRDFVYEVPRADADEAGQGLTAIRVSAERVGEASENLNAFMEDLLSKYSVAKSYQPYLRLQLRLWSHSRTLAGRRQTVAISLYALSNGVKHVGPSFLTQHLQRRPGLFGELCDVLQNLQAVGEEVGVAALRLTCSILDSRYGPSRAETNQLSQMLGLSVPHGIVACALRGLLGENPPADQLESHYHVLIGALDLFQVATASNHQTAVQLGHAGMILAMLELMQKVDIVSQPAIVAMLRCLELASEVSTSTAVILFREFRGLSAFSTRLQQEVDLLMALDFTGDVHDTTPPALDAPIEERTKYWNLLAEVTARRRLCRQLLKNIQVALQCSEAVQAGLANAFQGPLMDVLKTALQAPQKVGLSLFGTAIDIVSGLVQDDPSRVPQMIDSGVLPGILGALNKETMRSVECLSFVPGVLAAITLHSAGEDFIFNSPTDPIRLLIEILVDPSYAALTHAQPELAQIMSTHIDKALRNKPSGTSKLTDRVVDSIIDAMKQIIAEANSYAPWNPTDLQDKTQFLADRLSNFGRCTYSILGTNEHTLARFLEKGGLQFIQELPELPCLPYQLCSLEGQPHLLGSLFNLQAASNTGNTAVLKALGEQLQKHHTDIVKFMQAHFGSTADCPYGIMARLTKGAGNSALAGFLHSLSGFTAALEGLQTVCREGTNPLVLESLVDPVTKLVELVPTLFYLAAWRPRQKETKHNPFDTFVELMESAFKVKPDDPYKDCKDFEDLDPNEYDKEEGQAMLHTARQCFGLSAQTIRQFLVLTCKQLHSRPRPQKITPTVLALSYKLAEVSKAFAAQEKCPTDTVVALRWCRDAFDLLLKMHEEQNRVAIRPLCLCAFYQLHGFAGLSPMLQFIANNLDKEHAPAALTSGITYLEKVTSFKRFSNAPQANLLRTDDGLIPKDPLSRSVQGEALKCVLPVWRSSDFSKFPDNIGHSLMKVWVHTLDGPKDIPARPAPGSASASASAGAGQPTANAGNLAPRGDTSRLAQLAAMRGGTSGDEALTQAIIGAAVDTGFERDQAERGIRQQIEQGGALDMMTLITQMASSGVPGARTSSSETSPVTVSQGVGSDGKLVPMTTEQFQMQVADMLSDLLPRVLTFGRQVPKALPMVADTLAIVVGCSMALWAPLDPEKPRKSGQEENAARVVQACLAEIEQDDLLPPTDTLACVAQVLANLLHRRPVVATAMGEDRMSGLLKKFQKWALMSVDFSVPPFTRGYRTACFSSIAPAPPGVGEALPTAPTWLTPVVVCAHQLLSLADLVKLRDSKTPLDPTIQRDWVARIFHILYAFPGMDSGLAMACMQVLTRLCSASIGRKAFLEYQPRLLLDPSGKGLKTMTGGPGGLLMLLRLAKQAAFPGMLPLLADFILLLLEEGPLLQQRMESEILALFGPQVRSMAAKDITKQLFPLMSRSPETFEEALKAVTQQPHGAQNSAEPLMLEMVPEADRPHRGPRLKSVEKLPTPQMVMQALVSEACFSLEIQHATTFQKIHDLVTKAAEAKESTLSATPTSAELEQQQKDTAAKAAAKEVLDKLAPPFPLALGPDSILYLLDFVLTRIPGLGSLLLKTPTSFPPAAAIVPEAGDLPPENFLVVPPPAVMQAQKSLLLVMTRHLIPRFARLTETWTAQVDHLPSQLRAQVPHGSSGSSHAAPVHRCLPHLATCLCAAARHSSEPRRSLVLEAIVALKSLAEGPGPGSDSRQRGSYAAQVSAIAGLVSRLLSAAAAAEKKALEEKDEKQEGGAEDASSRPSTAEAKGQSSTHHDGQTPRRKQARKDTGFFTVPGETAALREALVAILSHMDLCRSESSAVSTTVIKCLEFLTRREPRKDTASAADTSGGSAVGVGGVGVIQDESMESVHAGFQQGDEEDEDVGGYPGEYVGEGDGPEDEEDEEEDEDDDMGGPDDPGLDDGEGMEGIDAMDLRDDGANEMDMDPGGEEDDDDYDDEEVDDGFVDVMADDGHVDEGPGGPHGLAGILNNAIHVFDQQGLHPENMTLRVDIDLGDAGAVHGITQHGQLRPLRASGRGGGPLGSGGPMPSNGGWSEPGDLDTPVDHPLLRRENHHNHASGHHHRGMPGEDGRAWQWMQRGPGGSIQMAPGDFYTFEGGRMAPGPPRGSPPAGSGGGRNGSSRGQAAAALEGFDETFGELSTRLRSSMRVAPPPPPPATTGGAAASSSSGNNNAAAPAPAPAGGATAPSSAEPTPAPAAASETTPTATPAPAPAPASTAPAATPSSTAPAAEGPPASSEATPTPMAVDPPAQQSQASDVDMARTADEVMRVMLAAAESFAPPAPPPAPAPAPAPAAAAAAATPAPASTPAAEAAEAPTAPAAAPTDAVAETEGDAPAAGESAAAQDTTDYGIPELARLADRLGCTQTEILEAAQIDREFVMALPLELRPDVMGEISEANLGSLRRSRPGTAGTTTSGGASSRPGDSAPTAGGGSDASTSGGAAAAQAADAPAEGAAQEEDTTDFGIPALTRLAERLGCTQTAILQAAQVDPQFVLALPEDLRPVIMDEINQVNLDHLRRPRPGSAAEAGAAAPAAGAGGGAAGGLGGGDDAANFIASLDPLLREEVLMTAPDELIQTLPAELVTEAQMLRERAFARIAARPDHHHHAPQVIERAPQQALQARPPQPLRQLAPDRYLQAVEQQILQASAGGGRRQLQIAAPAAVFTTGRGGGITITEDMLRQLGLGTHVRVHTHGDARSLMAFTGGGGGGNAPQGLSSFDQMDRPLLERLGDYDEPGPGQSVPELPLSLTAIPSICRLLYLRHEVAVAPMTRLFFNLALHPSTRNSVLGHFLFLLCRTPEAGASPMSLPPPHMFENFENGRSVQVNSSEIQSAGTQRVLAILAYLLRRLPQCGEFFSKKWQLETWKEVLGSNYWTPSTETQPDADTIEQESLNLELPGHHFINLLLQLLKSKLFLTSSFHATWLLAILHALLVHKKKEEKKKEDPDPQQAPPEGGADASPSASASATGPAGVAAAAIATATAATGTATSSTAPASGSSPTAAAAAGNNNNNNAEGAASPTAASSAGGEGAEGDAKRKKTTPTAEELSLQRWTKVTEDMHGLLTQGSVLALCHFLCQAGSGYSSSAEGDTFQMTTDILVSLAASESHFDMVRAELMRVLVALVTDIEASLAQCEAMTAEPSTLETRFLRVVRALAEVFKGSETDHRIEEFLGEAKVDKLWEALDSTLDRLADTEVLATPAQRLLSSGAAPSAVRVESSSGLSEETRAHLASNVPATPPKPLLNRLLPLIEAFFVLHDGNKEAAQDKKDKEERGKANEEQGITAAAHVFADLLEVSLVEKAPLGQFCKRHRTPLNALVKQTPSLLSKSFTPLLKHMPMCLDFDNKRANFRSQLRSRRLESRYETIRLRVRRSEIFIDSYHQLKDRTGEEMRAKIQVQFHGEEGVDAGGVGKEWYTALAREIFNPNYALFIQAGGKACTYHPNPMSYVNPDHLRFFKFIGRVVGKAIHDSQNLEAWFTRGFYKHMLGKKVIPADLEAFDPEYFSNLKWMLDHDITNVVELTFCAESDELGQQKIVDLKPHGRDLPVTNDNKHEYIQLMAEHKMTKAVQQQIDSFLEGLHEIVPPELLSVFDDKELELLISGLPDIDIEDLQANTEYHNYTPQSEQVQWFWKVLSEFNQEQRAWFLQFATGTTRVPVEGFKGLVGMRGPQKFSIHRAYGADRLPSAHTCFNQLDLPDYPSEDVLRQKLLQAVREGHEGFGFA